MSGVDGLSGNQNRQSWTDSTLPIAAIASAIAFGAGGILVALTQQHRWSWTSPLSLSCMALAALIAGIAVMQFILVRIRDSESETLRQEIEESRRYARELIGRASQARTDAS